MDAALLEVDALERAYPPIDRERSISHLATLASSYREIGTDLLIVTATLEDDAYRQAVFDATGATGICWSGSKPSRRLCASGCSHGSRRDGGPAGAARTLRAPWPRA